MKASNLSTPSLKLALITVLFFIPIMAFSQNGKVWTNIQDINGLALTINADKKISSQNTALNATIQTLQITSIEKAFPASRSRELSKVYEITCNCDENDLLQQVTSKKNFFQNAEIAPSYTTLDTPNDYSTVFTNDYALNLINAEAAWDVTHGDPSIVVAITDENYYINHEELIGKYNYLSPSFTNTTYTHGTAVAITAAGNTNNGIGKSAIGYNSTLQLRAMNYNEVLAASNAGARIVNMSWAATCYNSYYSQLVIDEAYANGTILVAAAGNGSTCGGPDNLVYPAAYNHVIAVSSVGPYDNHERSMGNPSTTHQHNSSVDICAPGYDVALSVAPGNYLTGNGSSYAAPYVSGTIALMLAVNPCLNYDQIELILKQTAVNIDGVNPSYIGKLGAGRMDAGAAVYMASRYATMSLTGTATVSCSTMEQGIALDMNSVQAPYQITWNTGNITPTLSNIAPGTYSVIVRDSNGCVGFFETVIDTVVPMTFSADIFPVTCTGENSGNVEIEVNGGHGVYTYEWTNGDTTQNAYGLPAGFYAVTVTDSKGCTATEEYLVNEPNLLYATINHQNARYNNPGSIDVTVFGGNYPYTYAWNNNATSQDLDGLSVGFYEVLITDAKGCLASANASVQSFERDILVDNEISNNAVLGSEGKQHDNSILGNEVINETMEVKEKENMVFNIYPNPATDFTTVTWESMEVATIQVFNMSGKLVKNDNVDRLLSKYILQGLERGEYLVRLVALNGDSVVKKVVFM